MMQKIAMTARLGIGVAGVLAVCAGAPLPAAAEQDAAEFIAQLGAQAMQVVGPSIPPSRRAARFRELFDRDFDLPDIARFVLGRYRHSLPPTDRQQFFPLFRESLVQAYTARLADYAGEPFRVTGSRQQGDETIVSSEVRRGDHPTEIDWHVVDRGGHFLVTDVYVDRVSMKVTERSEFAKIIERNGGRTDALVAVLRQQLAPAR